MSDSPSETPAQQHRSGGVDTFQGLIVAFAMAMAFRGFVLEGFVIPTGSMAPTLLGQHIRVRSDASGYAYAADDGALSTPREKLYDPMVTRQFPMSESETANLRAQVVGGDRVLVLKYVPWVFQPKRWDVVVFKQPPDPIGAAQNFIKRMVGMPSQSLLLVDGDVFTGAQDAAPDALRIERKPEMIQRAVWQPVWASDWVPVDLKKLESAWRRPWPGAAFAPAGENKSAWVAGDTRVWKWPTANATQLAWSAQNFSVTDWNAYNVWRSSSPPFPMSDIRATAVLEFDQPEKANASFVLNTRSLCITAAVSNATKSIDVTVQTAGAATEPARTLAQGHATLSSEQKFLDIEFWHVDQAVWLFVNGVQELCIPYEFTNAGTTPEMRLVASGIDPGRYRNDPVFTKPAGIQSMMWNFSGSPVTVRNMKLDRDLYYQPGVLPPGNQVSTNGSMNPKAFATDIDHPARLGPTDYLMLGDNSPASSDGRFWGRPHPILQRLIGFKTQFVVPQELIVGKAWCVYFPATYPLATGLEMQDPSAKSPNMVPNFGSLRFIR